MATKKPDQKAARASLPQASDDNLSEQGSAPVAAADLVDSSGALLPSGVCPSRFRRRRLRIDTALRLSDKPA